jgi:hypothetical protein
MSQDLLSSKEAAIHLLKAGMRRFLLLEAHSHNTLRVGGKHPYLHTT